MESPSETYAGYARLFGELADRVDAGVEFVQRRTYSELNELLLAGELDAALLCTGGYLELLRRDAGAVELVAVPVIGGSDTYQSLIIVPAGSSARSLEDLRGQRFAFTDELSLTGRAWVLHALRQKGLEAEGFFREVTFTRGHDRSVAAVARGLVDGAAVHSVVFQHLLEKDPGLFDRVRVVQRSPGFGMTPVVVSTRLPAERRAELKRSLLIFADDATGRRLLETLRINRFETPPAGLFDTAIEVVGGPHE
jgi:phosphonate transport system substrate-binding protein